MSVKTFGVVGMTCEHCVHAVGTELGELPGVTDVRVTLVTGGTSPVQVTGDPPPTDDMVAAALDEAGDYRLA